MKFVRVGGYEDFGERITCLNTRALPFLQMVIHPIDDVVSQTSVAPKHRFSKRRTKNMPIPTENPMDLFVTPGSVVPLVLNQDELWSAAPENVNERNRRKLVPCRW